MPDATLTEYSCAQGSVEDFWYLFLHLPVCNRKRTAGVGPSRLVATAAEEHLSIKLPFFCFPSLARSHAAQVADVRVARVPYSGS